jgi:5-methylthioadenosine/S-adenosylhomocysteine deaminase
VRLSRESSTTGRVDCALNTVVSVRAKTPLYTTLLATLSRSLLIRMIYYDCNAGYTAGKGFHPVTRVLLRNLTVELPDGGFASRDLRISGGVIVDVSETRSGQDDFDEYDMSGHLGVAGLANCHTHSNENWFRGLFDNLPLEPWMIYSYPTLFAPVPDERDVYLRTVIGAMEAARTGTTAIVDFIYEFTGFTEARLAAMVSAYRDVGIRALICLAIADRPFEETVVLDHSLLDEQTRRELNATAPMSSDESMDMARALVEKFHDPQNGIAIGLGPSGPQRCTDTMLMASRSLADELDLQIHTHVLETKMQRRSGMDLYGKSIVGHLADIGFLSPRTHLVHGVWLDENDAKTLSGTGATVVHNPISNLKLGSGVSPITLLRKHGVPVSLGTDGMCAGDGQNMFEAVKLAGILHKVEPIPYRNWIGGRQAWDIATRGGSVATGGAGQRGVIAVGQQADILMLDLDDYAFTPLNDPMVHLTLQIPTQALTHVMVAGRFVMQDRLLTGVKEPELLDEIRRKGPGIVAAHHEAFAFGDRLIPSLEAGWQEVLAWDAPLSSYLR